MAWFFFVVPQIKWCTLKSLKKELASSFYWAVQYSEIRYTSKGCRKWVRGSSLKLTYSRIQKHYLLSYVCTVECNIQLKCYIRSIDNYSNIRTWCLGLYRIVIFNLGDIHNQLSQWSQVSHKSCKGASHLGGCWSYT